MIDSNPRTAALYRNPELLQRILRGIEKESLRVDSEGRLALTAHPAALGSALTNPRITTDYSEALLELITPPHAGVSPLMAELDEIHRYVAQNLGDEFMWSQSMPAELPPEPDIPIGWYGTSNSGMLKHVYRRGLAERYGKTMQCIAGVHYNFSVPDALWEAVGVPGDSDQDRRTHGYMALIRNFMRHSWLLMFLFGASPAVSTGFLRGAQHHLDAIGDHTLYLPHATSLRMSDLGYQNRAQSTLQLCYNDLETFVLRIVDAVTTPWPPYAEIGTHRDGQWIQLNGNILQIENEYYSSIRPKRTTGRCERPSTALAMRGIEYIEVRCLDIDPTTPLGITEETCRFLDVFLLACAFEDSPYFPDPGFCQDSQDNFARVAKEGRKPGLTLAGPDGPMTATQWGERILQDLVPYAQALDAAFGTTGHIEALEIQRRKIDDPGQTPSAQVLAAMRESGLSLHDHALAESRRHHAELLSRPLVGEALDTLQALALESFAEQARLEAEDSEDFAAYVARFQAALMLAPAP